VKHPTRAKNKDSLPAAEDASPAAPKLTEQLPAVFVAALTTLTVIAPLVPFDTAAIAWNNVLPLMLWLVLLLAWALAGFARGELVARFDATTLAVLLLTLVPALSAAALASAASGNARLAINLAWQWVGCAGGFGVRADRAWPQPVA
jgi:hypothetical protein